MISNLLRKQRSSGSGYWPKTLEERQHQLQIYPTVHKYSTASNTNISNTAQIHYEYIQQYTDKDRKVQIYPTVHKYKYIQQCTNRKTNTNVSNSAQIQYSISYNDIQQCTNTIQNQPQIYPTVQKYKNKQQCTITDMSNNAQIQIETGMAQCSAVLNESGGCLCRR